MLWIYFWFLLSFPLTHMSILMLIPHYLDNCSLNKYWNQLIWSYGYLTENPFTQPENLWVLTTLKYKEENTNHTYFFQQWLILRTGYRFLIFLFYNVHKIIILEYIKHNIFKWLYKIMAWTIYPVWNSYLCLKLLFNG